MKQHLTTDLAEFTRTVERVALSATDYLAPTTELRTFSNEDGTMLDVPAPRPEGQNTRWPVNDHAHGQISAFTGIPKAYYDRMRRESPALLDTNIDRWFREPKQRLIRTLNGEVRAFLSDRYQRIDDIDIMRAINPVLGELAEKHPETRVESSALTGKRMYLKVVVPTVFYEIPPSERNVGDILQAGFVISNSEVGAGMFTVERLVYKLICKNGMIAGERLARRHVGSRITGTDAEVWSERTQRLDDRTILSAAQDMVRAAVDETLFQSLAAQMHQTIDTTPLVVPTKAVEVLAKKHSLTDEEGETVLRNLYVDEQANGLGLFGLLNAVTRTSQGVEDYERATELERLGGVLLDMPAQEWETLAAVRA